MQISVLAKIAMYAFRDIYSEMINLGWVIQCLENKNILSECLLSFWFVIVEWNEIHGMVCTLWNGISFILEQAEAFLVHIHIWYVHHTVNEVVIKVLCDQLVDWKGEHWEKAERHKKWNCQIREQLTDKILILMMGT